MERLDIAYLKWDHNSPLLAAGHEVADPTAGRQGAAAVHDQTLAVYRLLDALHERFPALEIESCAGGGGRIDLGIMERTQRVWASDCIDAHDRQNIQRGTTLLLPPELVGTHVGSGRAHTTLRDLDLDFRAGTALWGHMGVEWDLTEADDATRERLASIIALHKELRGLLHSGVTVHADCPTTMCCASRASSPLTAPTPCSRSPRWVSSWPGPRRRARCPVWTPRAATTWVLRHRLTPS